MSHRACIFVSTTHKKASHNLYTSHNLYIYEKAFHYLLDIGTIRRFFGEFLLFIIIVSIYLLNLHFVSRSMSHLRHCPRP